MYDTREEATQKLGGSVVLFDKKPTHIYEGQGSKDKVKLKALDCRTRKEFSENISDPRWNFKDLGEHIGYVNIDYGKGGHQEAIFLSRMPIRNTHGCQGISQKNLKIPNLLGSHRLGLTAMGLRFENLASSPSFCDMMELKYPSIKQIEDSFKSNTWLTSKAFDRKFAVRLHDVGPYYLQYRGKDIGFSSDFFKWKIGVDFKHLYEYLEHLKLKVA